MRRVHRSAWLLAAALAIPGAVGSVPASAADVVAPLAVEGFAYPDAARLLAEQNITLKTGDGNIRLAECNAASGLVWVSRRQGGDVCFKVTGASGYLAMEISQVYKIKGDDHAVKAMLDANGTVSSVDILKNEWTSVGEGDSPTGQQKSVLLELSAGGGTAAASSGEFAAVGSVAVGAAGHAGSRGCTGTLVDPLWVLTSAGCFTDNPGSLAAGAPAAKSTFTVGGRAVDISELAPRTDRDAVLARLAAPVTDIAPVKLATTAPASGAGVKVAGFGRTATDWWSTKARTTAQTLGAVSATGLDITPANGAAPVCAGDSGAPLLADRNGTTELVGVVSRSWRGGCLGTPSVETRTNATGSRIDDLGQWVQQTRFRTASVANSFSNRCLYVSWRTPDNGGPAQQVGCDRQFADQVWKLEPVTGGGYQFRNPVTNRCLFVSWRTPGNNVPVTQYDCNPEWGDQVWYLDPVASGGYQIRNSVTNRCMYVSWRTPEDGAPVLQYDCNPEWADQVWKI
ncbi:trypsin-like serine protease [Streptomyces sp. NRRL B-24484]|uniref:trypsin-like serine protease n=1 Tax=Streptomyces sp. NRRL B-24484 TaxID=1463833 RepID=UPI0013312201|nr:trypsin-like serine protease [Streptomyces sp. NRRL B-24484]